MHNIAMLDDLGFQPFLVIFSFQTRNSNLETRNQFGLCPVLYRQRAASTKIYPTNPAIPPSLFAKIFMQIRTISSPRTSRKNNFCNSPFHFTADTELRLLLRFLCALLLKSPLAAIHPGYLSRLSALCVSSVPSHLSPDCALRLVNRKSKIVNLPPKKTSPH
jgi:hypothetical protein